MKRGWHFKELILKEIKKHGGWVNAHAHADRAFTINPKTLDVYKNHSLEEKWDLVDAIKKDATVTDYYDRVCRAIEVLLGQGVSVFGSFIDVDPVCRDRAILGAMKARDRYRKDMTIRFANQTLKGVIAPESRKWFDVAASMVDIIGGLPRRDERDFGKGAQHLDILLEAGKTYKKLVHVHVDQFNTPTDRETELLCDKTIEHDMQGRVVAIHGISIAARSKSDRRKLYTKMKQAGMMMISCPVAWIDSPRTETVMPFHNALTPIDELIPAGITVALGTDNICDYMVPFCDGDMWQELSLLMTGCRYPEIDEMIKVATVNGRRVLGV